MTMNPIGAYAPQMTSGAAGPSGDNERAERMPDNEAMEMGGAKAPLASYQGNRLDIEA